MLVAGTSTFFFATTTGALLSSATVYSGGAAYPVITPGAGNGAPIRVPRQDVTYEYTVEGVTYRSGWVGMGVASWTLWPLGKMQWEIDASSQNSIRVYYYQLYPQIAVVHRGIDILGLATLLFVGIGLIRFSIWLDSHVAA
jgi:hypothetical protein